jgi:hypothetical protein
VPTFTSHFEKALRVSAGAAVNGRLQGAADVVLTDVANPAITKTAHAPYELLGPGDVKRLAAGAITRRFPAPGASNAEAAKLALVEFAAPDAPWRYTPERPVAGRLRPWLVLVVGRRAPDDIILRPDGRVTLGLAAQSRHPLSQSWKWAHVHQVQKRSDRPAGGPAAGRPRRARLPGGLRICGLRRSCLHPRRRG